MDWWLWIPELLALLALLLAIPLVWLTSRRRWLSRRGAAFDCSVRLRETTPGTGWVLGVARYRDDELQWFPSFGPSFRPRLVFKRGEVRAGAQRGPSPTEAIVLFDDMRIMKLIGPKTSREVAMAPDSLTGLLSWLESAAPGRYESSPR